MPLHVERGQVFVGSGALGTLRMQPRRHAAQCPDKKRCPLKLLRARGRPRARRATSMSTLKRYRSQSIICNNGFLKTTFHRPPPGGHVVSPHICQF
ncbi:Uncharacterized protein DBV15_08151 [Temnothorax longispinosus]|uniref:Uncharacterized protein n=1 Tax=Temnothorax longispinosus TaxID=300112 RepID=A0A4S2L1Z7_9HYME|nr:Uncharacterized protein DBV15_08151 [Temnothorax longispinosus]